MCQLTLEVDEQVLAQAEAVAETENTTVTTLLQQFVESLTSIHRITSNQRMTPACDLASCRGATGLPPMNDCTQSVGVGTGFKCRCGRSPDRATTAGPKVSLAFRSSLSR